MHKTQSLRTTMYSQGIETNMLHLSILWLTFMIDNKLLELILQFSLRSEERRVGKEC